MAVADTLSYDEMVLEVEFTAESGTYTKICGITGVTINRSANVTTSEIPDCDDETVPHSVVRDVRSIEVTASGTGVWAMSSHPAMHDWFYSGASKNARLRNTKVESEGTSGDPYQESGPAILASLSNERPDDKGRVTAQVEIQFSGTPTVTEVS
ncbi:MAG: hypothetical protein CML68_13455 [Rhodobacteraceae bacterium]|nr:hypothetical protein [Paracoccaceae bacterium]